MHTFHTIIIIIIIMIIILPSGRIYTKGNACTRCYPKTICYITKTTYTKILYKTELLPTVMPSGADMHTHTHTHARMHTHTHTHTQTHTRMHTHQLPRQKQSQKTKCMAGIPGLTKQCIQI